MSGDIEVFEEDKQQNDNDEKFDLKKEIISWIKVLVFSVLLAWIIGSFVLMIAYIPSGSMENTLHVDDKVIGLRFAYKLKDPERFDVIMFKFPDNEKKDYIKRIIGLPGEKVTVTAGKVYINDSQVPLDEPYIKGVPVGDFGPYQVPEDSFFVMGDNRNDSWDSRYWYNNYVKREKILAKAVCRFWPLNQMKLIKKE